MQAKYPQKQEQRIWDTVHLTYPVRKFPTTGKTSEAIGHCWREQPEILRTLREPIEEIQNYVRDYNVTKELTRSQTTEDFGFKLPDKKRFNKHTSCLENKYINNPSRRLADRVPATNVHGTTEMRDRYVEPELSSRLVTNKDQFKHPHTLRLYPPPEQSWHKELEPLDTTHDGFEKFLDSYLTTSRLHHRPFTADQLQKPSNTKDIVTYYTFADIPWAWGPKPKIDEWKLPLGRPKSMYDKEKFNYEFREVRTHNKLKWAPGTFRTEVRDNYVQQTSRPEAQIHNFEEEVRTHYERSIASLKTNEPEEYSMLKGRYATESTQIGSRKPICAVFDPFKQKNRRLESKNQIK